MIAPDPASTAQLLRIPRPTNSLNPTFTFRDSEKQAGHEYGNDKVFALLERIGRRDEAAMRELYCAYSRKVYAYVLNHCRDAEEAEEIVVDTLHEVWKHPERFRGEAKFNTWLIGIARHKMLSAIRARHPEHDDLDEQMPSDDEGVFEVLAAKQRRESVQRCMSKLPDEQRECLHLVFYEGMSLAEVAEIQSCPENTVKTRLFHARQKIKNCLRRMLQAEE